MEQELNRLKIGRSEQSKGRPHVKCFACNGMGHIAKFCKN
ncbi:hypothetical protein H7673_10585 [Streptococcus dysgalactiae subsp. equisimilis]|nr:hypothetical protein [Streptococcus dysgalactiae subsp. equisimilis]